MEQAVVASVAPKPRSNRTAIAVVLVIAFLAAFAAAFYFLGGVELVSGLLGFATPATSPPTGNPGGASKGGAAPAASAGATATTASGLNLPDGVDEAFARRMYVEQLESQGNIAKLVDAQAKALTFGAVRTAANGVEVDVKATFADKTSANGILGMAQKQGKWFFVFISGKRSAATGGEADTVAADGGDTLAGHASTANPTIDPAVLNTILDEQVRSQDVLGAIADGAITRIAVDGVSRNVGTATLQVTMTGSGTPIKGKVLLIQKSIDGTDSWFITSFTKS